MEGGALIIVATPIRAAVPNASRVPPANKSHAAGPSPFCRHSKKYESSETCP